jgi:hypothetical protein
MPEAEKAKRGWQERLRDKREQRRRKALERAKVRHDEGVGASARADLARRDPDQGGFGGGGGA